MQFAATLLHACNHFSRLFFTISGRIPPSSIEVVVFPRKRGPKFARQEIFETTIEYSAILLHRATISSRSLNLFFFFFLFTADLHLVSFCQCPGGEHFGA